MADQGIEQSGAFMRDVLRQQEMLSEISSGSTLSFHTVTLPDDWQPVRLTAFRPEGANLWGIRVTGIGDVPTHPRTMPGWIISVAPLMQGASWESAEEAFAAIEAALRRANELDLLAG